jgi:tetratricopeptide (TPR) repeat protein
MKFILYVTIIIHCFSAFSQESDTDELLRKGNDAYVSNDFQTAEKLYTKVLKSDSTNVDLVFNLALTKLNLGKKSSGCELLQKAYKLRDEEAGNLILEHCGEIEYNENMFYKDVDQLPKFKDGDQIYDLITEAGINKILFEKLRKKFKKSKILKKIEKGKIYVMFKIDIDGNIESRTTGPDNSSEINKEVNKLLKDIAIYIPCQYKNKPVGMFNAFWLPIEFN